MRHKQLAEMTNPTKQTRTFLRRRDSPYPWQSSHGLHRTTWYVLCCLCSRNQQLHGVHAEVASRKPYPQIVECIHDSMLNSAAACR
jgi:hypothetical protein